MERDKEEDPLQARPTTVEEGVNDDDDELETEDDDTDEATLYCEGAASHATPRQPKDTEGKGGKPPKRIWSDAVAKVVVEAGCEGVPASSILKKGMSLDGSLPLDSDTTTDDEFEADPHQTGWNLLLDSFISNAKRVRHSKSFRAQLDEQDRPELVPTSLTIHVATWNMNEQDTPQHIHLLTHPHNYLTAPVTDTGDGVWGTHSLDDDVDMYVIGTQEGTLARRAWVLKLQENLGPGFVPIHTNAIYGIQLCVFLRKQFVWFVRRVESHAVATGLGGMLRTKGGIGVSMVFHHTSFLFVNSHLCAHMHKLKERNEHYVTIRRNLALPKSRQRRSFAAMPRNVSSSAVTTDMFGVAAHSDRDVTQSFDYSFWCGDLNYRNECTREEAFKLIEAKDWEELKKRDQLQACQRDGLAFSDFSEGIINFAPTFKFDNGTDTYDTSPKQRVPSWTDRILWKARDHPETSVECLCYDSIPDLCFSDHKPVYGRYLVQLREGDVVDGLADVVDDMSLKQTQYDFGVYMEGIHAHLARAKKTHDEQEEEAAAPSEDCDGDDEEEPDELSNTITLTDDMSSTLNSTLSAKPTLSDTIRYRSAICAIM
eukprot:m.359914 g.359914  ORF g.359914 m.359914 type:complete len:597 (-) comp18818_c0_seq1:699-2489(-)